MAGRTYQFDLQGAASGKGTLADTFLRRIRDANGVKSLGDGNHRTYNDDFEGSRDSRVTFTATASGTYYVEVSGDRDETGTYTLTVADVTPEPETEERQTRSQQNGGDRKTDENQGRPDRNPPPPVVTEFDSEEEEDDEELVSLQQQSVTIPDYVTNDRFDPVEIGGSLLSYVGLGTPLTDGVGPGVTGYATGIAWFKVKLSAGFPYRFEAAPFGSRDPLDFPTIEGVYKADGNPITATFSSAAIADVVPTTSGTYYVAVGGEPIGNPAFLNGTHSGWVTLFATQTDDYGDSVDALAATIGEIAVGGFLTGELEQGTDRDTFAVELEAGKTYRIDVKGLDSGHGTLTDPVLLNLATGDPIAGISGTFNRDSGYGRNPRIVYAVPSGAGGTYYFGLSDGEITDALFGGASAAVGGTYRVEVNEVPAEDDYGVTQSTAGEVAVNDSVAGEIGPPVTDAMTMMDTADVDWFKVALLGGRTYRIEIEGASTDAGTLDDPHLGGIYNSMGESVSDPPTDTDGGEGLNTSVTYTAGSTGSFFIAVQGKTDDSLGTYRLSVTEFDDYTADTDTAGTVTVGGSTTGRIHYPHDRDWFRVTLEAGKEYQIDLRGTHAGGGTLFDPYLRGVHDSDGSMIDSTAKNDGGITYSSRLDFTPDATGTYYIAAGGAGYHTGTYTLEVVEVEETM